MTFHVRRRAAHARAAYRPSAIVAIPVQDEGVDLGNILAALGAQCDLHGHALAPASVAVLLLFDGCSDARWERMETLRGSHMPSWIAIDGDLPEASRHAGGARRAALLKALALAAPETTLIATTNADSMVPAMWLARQIDWLARGCEVVMGMAQRPTFDDMDPALESQHRLEMVYARWLDRIDAMLDPIDHDPWPRHRTPSSASLGFKREALQAMLPLPAPAHAHEQALIQRCVTLDLKIRADANLQVHNPSLAALHAGGMRSNRPLPFEPLVHAVTRSILRGQLRARHRAGTLSAETLTGSFAMPTEHAHAALKMPTFGRLWHEVEHSSPLLQHTPLLPSHLPREIEAALAWFNACMAGSTGPSTLAPAKRQARKVASLDLS
ncbi:hypothetical protein [Dyella sp.]|uniref:hypothetical protein n=1 Tax=Dyella sp. TaxID=1869338 RepID=UPI002ED375A8